MPAKFKLPELNPTAEIKQKFHVTATLAWEIYSTNMKPASVSVDDSHLIDNPMGVDELVGRMVRDNYKKS
eukprot:512585-Ditylum_brightwellii.AAC.1